MGVEVRDSASQWRAFALERARKMSTVHRAVGCCASDRSSEGNPMAIFGRATGAFASMLYIG